MKEIIVKLEDETGEGWVFNVEVDGLKYQVTLDKDYYQQLTKEERPPERLIEDSFIFLLQREPKEAILRKFNLSEIQKHFSEFEIEI